MSQTSTSHTQWIQHAVAAAKAGNPSVAKIQLQKAAEAAPGDPAVWLWMGWLADSPASAVQCLELARSDERFQKIADAGIDFAKALAEFQLELQEEVVVETWTEEPANVLVETSPVVSPVEAVEEVAAVVETLQQEDSAEPAIDSDSWERSTSNDDCESAISESVEQVSESGAATGEENDSTPDSPTDDSEADTTVQPVVDASDDFQTEAALEETVLAESDDSDLECDQPESAGSDKTNAVEAYASDAAPVAANDVESELITSANELWQTTENVADSEPGTPEPAAHEPESGQQFWKPASSENRAAAVSGPASAQVTGAETPSEVFVDESDGDFAFASGEDVEFKRFVPIRSKPIANNDNTNTQTENQPQDQWLGQSPDNAPAAPVWRKAHSDWFSVDGPSNPEPDQPVPALDTQVPFSAADSPVTENSEVYRHPGSSIWRQRAVAEPAAVCHTGVCRLDDQRGE